MVSFGDGGTNLVIQVIVFGNSPRKCSHRGTPGCQRSFYLGEHIFPDVTHGPVKVESKDRLRLQKASCEEIAERVRDELGFQAECRSGTVYIWDDESNHIATFSWRKGRGWCLMVRQPVTYTRHDLGHAIEEIRRCRAGMMAADEAWEKFKKGKTNKNWAEYQGALAAHFFRLYGGDG